jgi:pimeloyl-[acyl-carrier protein] methyl ester esterase
VRKCTDKPAVLNGWSLGGAVAVEAAGLLGSACAGVVLTCGAAPRFIKADELPPWRRAGFARGHRRPRSAETVRRSSTAGRAVYCALPVSDAMIDSMWAAFIDSGPGAIESLIDLGRVRPARCAAGAAGAAPVHVVGGADAILDPGVGKAAAEMAPHGTLALIEGCGHAPFIEAAEAYNAALPHDFLAKL